MKYKMKVTIANPNLHEEINIERDFVLDCVFCYNPDTYGNGYYVSIKGKDFYPLSYDIRYDLSFDRGNKKKWLEEWARSYWTGKDGAWAIKSLEIVNA